MSNDRHTDRYTDTLRQYRELCLAVLNQTAQDGLRSAVIVALRKTEDALGMPHTYRKPDKSRYKQPRAV